MIFGLLFLGLQTFLAFFKPKYFLFTYLLYVSSFFGFLPNSIIFGGNEIGLFYHSILMLTSFIIFNKQIKFLPQYLKILLWGTLFLFLFGILYPVINDQSSIFQSIVASKEFSTIFLLHYLFINQKNLSFSLIEKNISFFGYVFLIILILFVFLNFIPPHYIKRPGEIQYNYPTILSLFLFIKAGQAKGIKKKSFVVILAFLWMLGMYYEGHDAIMLTTTIGVLIVLFRIPIIHFTKNFKWLILGILFLSIFLMIIPTNEYVNKILETPSFAARIIYNTERLELINERPLFGYGFLHKSAVELGDHAYTESLSFVDSGYIDLLGKFGYLGTVFYLLIITISFFKQKNNPVLLSIKIFFLQYFIVNITWSVFSFALGIIALSLSNYLYFTHNNSK